MIRTCILRSALLKNAIKKDAATVRVIRCFTVCSPHLKGLILRNGEITVTDLRIFKFIPLRRLYSDYPNHIKVALPALSPTMEFGTIVSWEKKEGDKLNEGDLLAEIETDKATMGFETPEEGYLAKILVPAGTKNVPVGKLVCIIVEKDGDVGSFKDFKEAEGTSVTTAAAPAPPPPSPQVTTKPAAPKPATPPPVALPQTKPDQRIYASPLARKIAQEKGISLKSLGKGSGIFGSITSQDLDRAPSARPVAGDHQISQTFVDLPLSNINSDSSTRLLHSKQSIPHYYLSVDVNLDKVLILKEKLNKVLQKDNINIGVDDFIIKAVALSCKKVPEANSSWQESFIRQYKTVDVGIAVNTDKGLLNPVVLDADLKGLGTISSDVKQLTSSAREGTLQPEECQGGTISVSNLSSYGIRNYTAIINPPQACNLSVGASEKRVVEDKSIGCGFRTCEYLPVTLSCDHRVIDGAVGAQWLASFRQFMEHPETMML